jgi:hypothetical protein
MERCELSILCPVGPACCGTAANQAACRPELMSGLDRGVAGGRLIGGPIALLAIGAGFR